MNPEPCALANCDGITGVPGTARGLCIRHYHRWQRHGDPLAGGQRRHRDPLDRIATKIELAIDGCWTWTGAKASHGYGNTARTTAHREVWELLIGPIPDGLTLDHLCRNPLCVNPDHLEPVTCAENLRRARLARSA
jgi:hypothetical protein